MLHVCFLNFIFLLINSVFVPFRWRATQSFSVGQFRRRAPRRRSAGQPSSWDSSAYGSSRRRHLENNRRRHLENYRRGHLENYIRRHRWNSRLQPLSGKGERDTEKEKSDIASTESPGRQGNRLLGTHLLPGVLDEDFHQE